ncbi:MFS transporter, partial [Burkholderia humptydooensis]
AAAAAAASARSSAKSIFDPAVLRMTIVGGLIGVGAHGGYHAITTWLPTYLKIERHLSVLGTGAYLAVIIVAFIVGCMTSAYLQDRIGRRRNLMLFAACCVVTVNLYVLLPLDNVAMLLLGFPLGFFAAGIPATLGALFNELYPRNVRGRGVGFCYNFGRVASAIFPVLVGHMGTSMPLGVALGIDAGIAYGLVFIAVWFLPETRARDFQTAQPDVRGREAAL